MTSKSSFFYRNGLSLAFLLFFTISLLAQCYCGWQEHNEFLKEQGAGPKSLGSYLISGHFIQATFENWESEFLQMALFVVLTVFLRQKGSSESKKCEEKNIDNSDLLAKADSPWPVKKGGFWLGLYKNSLSIALIFLFLVSFVFHWYGSWVDDVEAKRLKGQVTKSFTDFLLSPKLWFESFQNWQSEFFSVFAIVFLSIFLRQAGSPQSKPVNASHGATGQE